MNNFLRDVINQPRDLMNSLLLFATKEEFEKIDRLKKESFDKIIFSGMGSSHYAAYPANIKLNDKGFNSKVLSAGELLHYEFNSIQENTLLFLTSQSGESAEIISIINKLPENIKVVAITNNANSSLGRRGNYVFELNVQEEESVSTRTYISTLIILNIIAEAIANEFNESRLLSYKEAINSIGSFLSNQEHLSLEIGNFIKKPSYICIIGRGYEYSTAMGGGLFIRELAKFPAISMDSGEFRHGPFEIVDENFIGIVLAPDGKTLDLSINMAKDIVLSTGKVILISNADIEIQDENIYVIKTSYLEEFMAPIMDMVPIQLIANYIAESKGLEVGKFKWGTKVTTIE